MKVLHLPTSVGGFGWALAQAERSLGLDSQVLSLYGNYIDYPSDFNLRLEARGKAGRMLGHVGALLKYRSGYDVYHFNYGSSFVHFLNRGVTNWDLPFFDRRSKKIFTFNGCDARQKYPTMERVAASGHRMAACFQDDCYGGMCNSGALDRFRRKAIEAVERHADHIFAVNPDLMHFLPSGKTSFLPYVVPRMNEIAPKTAPFFRDDVVHVVHAPTQRAAKGSAIILEALEELEDELAGRLKITVVEGRTHAEALEMYREADLFIDQVLIGWYGGVAVEVMKMGIPVACFINEDDLGFVPSEMRSMLPFLRVNRFDIKERIREFVSNRDMAPELGRRGKAFAETWHDPARVACHVIAAYRGEVHSY